MNLRVTVLLASGSVSEVSFSCHSPESAQNVLQRSLLQSMSGLPHSVCERLNVCVRVYVCACVRECVRMCV